MARPWGPRRRARRCLLILGALAVAACGSAPRVAPPGGSARASTASPYPALDRARAPVTLDEALETLQRELPRETIDLLYASETDVTIELQEGLGRWMRDRWGLWTGSPLAEHLRGLGLEHPDDMSGVILTSLWRRLHFQPLRVDAQVRWYRAIRRAAEPPDPTGNPRCAGRVDIGAWWTPGASGSKTEAAGPPGASPATTPGAPALRIVHLGECSSDGRLWAWEAGRGWFEPDAPLRAYFDREVKESTEIRERE